MARYVFFPDIKWEIKKPVKKAGVYLKCWICIWQLFVVLISMWLFIEVKEVIISLP